MTGESARSCGMTGESARSCGMTRSAVCARPHERVHRGRARALPFVVLEVDVRLAPLLRRDALRPLGQRRLVVVQPVQAEIPPRGRGLHGTLEVVLFGHAERDVAVAQDREDFLVEPALVAEL